MQIASFLARLLLLANWLAVMPSCSLHETPLLAVQMGQGTESMNSARKHVLR